MKKYSVTSITMTSQAERDIQAIKEQLEKKGDSAMFYNKSYIIRKALQFYSAFLKENLTIDKRS